MRGRKRTRCKCAPSIMPPTMMHCGDLLYGRRATHRPPRHGMRKTAPTVFSSKSKVRPICLAAKQSSSPSFRSDSPGSGSKHVLRLPQWVRGRSPHRCRRKFSPRKRRRCSSSSSRGEKWVNRKKLQRSRSFSASDDSSFVNGVELNVDGGFSAICNSADPGKSMICRVLTAIHRSGIKINNDRRSTMNYAIVGFGKIGQALAHAFARKNIDVTVASRRPPEALAPEAGAPHRTHGSSPRRTCRTLTKPTPSSWRFRSGNIARLRSPCRVGKARRSSTR